MYPITRPLLTRLGLVLLLVATVVIRTDGADAQSVVLVGERITERATDIVNGHVGSTTSVEIAGEPFTVSEFVIEEALTGTLSGTVLIKTEGGVLEDGTEVFVSHQAELSPNDYLQLALVATPTDQAITLAAEVQPDLPVFSVVGGHEGAVGLDDGSGRLEHSDLLGNYVLLGAKWTSFPPVEYLVNTTNSGLGEAETLAAVKAGFERWEADIASTVDFTYAGPTTKTGYDVYDGENVVSWVETPDPADAFLAQVRWLAPAGEFLGFDIRMNRDYQWAIGAEFLAYDVETVIAHEGGHAIGLSHATASTDVMYYSIGHNTVKPLGTGDLAGARFLYPAPPTAPAVAMEFSPSAVEQYGETTLVVTVDNGANNASADELSFSFDGGTIVPIEGTESNSCGGVVQVVSEPATLTLADGSVPAFESCAFGVSVQPTEAGSPLTGDQFSLTSSLGVSEFAAGPLEVALVATATIVDASVSVTPAVVAPGEAAEVSIVFDNSTGAVDALNFEASLPLAARDWVVAGSLSSTCGGDVDDVGFSGTRLDAGESCELSAQVHMNAPGAYDFVGPASSTLPIFYSRRSKLTVTTVPPTISAAFSPENSIGPVDATLTIDVTNNAAVELTALDVSPTLGRLRLVGDSVTSCGGSVDRYGRLRAGSIEAYGSCSLSFAVSAVPGEYQVQVNATSALGTAEVATAEVSATAPAPEATLAFDPESVVTGETAAMVITIDNREAPVPAEQMSLRSSLAANLTYDLDSLSNTCGGRAEVFVSYFGRSTLWLTDGLLAAGQTCSITLNLSGEVANSYYQYIQSFTTNLGGETGFGVSIDITGQSIPALISQTELGVHGGSAADELFGATIASGDFNNDRYGDIVIGAPGERSGSGSVSIARGSYHGLGTHSAPRELAMGAPGTAFGTAVAVGDFNADGYDDIAVGAPRATVGPDTNAGSVHIYLSRAYGFSDTPTIVIDGDAPGLPGIAEADDLLGSALVAGDFDNDGDDDLAIGLPGEAIGPRAGAGAVLVLNGGELGITPIGSKLIHGNSRGVPGIAEANDNFGAALASGDFDGDGVDDLAIGSPGEGLGSKRGAGAVHVLSGSPSGVVTAGAKLLSSSSPGVPGASETGDAFGATLAAGDFDADRHDDLAVGIPHEAIGSLAKAGGLTVFNGSPSGVQSAGSRWFSGRSAGLHGAAETGDRFAGALTAGDINNDGVVDLAIGIPGEAIGSIKGAGAVIVVHGSAAGLDASDSRWMSGDSRRVPGIAERGDAFGSAITIVRTHFQGNRMVVGAPGEALGSVPRAGALIEYR